MFFQTHGECILADEREDYDGELEPLALVSCHELNGHILLRQLRLSCIKVSCNSHGIHEREPVRQRAFFFRTGICELLSHVKQFSHICQIESFTIAIITPHGRHELGLF